MERITQSEFDAIPRDEFGIKHCPTADYSLIRDFPKGCSFAEGCSFAKGCSFAERCSFAEWCSFAKGCSFAEKCSFAKACSFAERCKAISPYWAFVYEPPFKTEGRILPPSSTRSYWEERLGLKLAKCYEEIAIQLQPLLPELLERKDWTKCERRILESWK